MPLVWGIKPKGNTIKPNADHKKISAVTNSTIVITLKTIIPLKPLEKA